MWCPECNTITTIDDDGRIPDWFKNTWLKKNSSQFRKDFINRKGLIAMIEKQKGDPKTKERMLVIIRTYIPNSGGNQK
jgi:hypothetical protein